MAVAAALWLAAALAPAGAGASTPAWTTYRHDAARSGIDPDSAQPVAPSPAWQTPHLDGDLWAQPLVYGSRVYAATENDTIYALDAATGAVVWSHHLATPEPSRAAGCGDISPNIGITSTPVIDPATNRIYAVGAVSVNGTISHELFALDLNTGALVPGFPVNADPPKGSPVDLLQRTALTLRNGRVIAGFGGNDGDCGSYWGWLVSLSTNPPGAKVTFQADSQGDDHGGAIWGSGTGPAVDASGRLWAATGNGFGSSTFDFGESVIAFDANLQPAAYWAPTNWKSLDDSDSDLGSSEPALLPDNLVLQTGKDGNAYLISATNPGGVSAPVDSVHFCSGQSFGGAVYLPASSTIYAACVDGVKALSLNLSGTPFIAPKSDFAAPSDAVGPPVYAGGLVWATAWNTQRLLGLNPSTGAIAFQYPLDAVEHFATPSAGGGRLFLGAGPQVLAFTIATPTPAGGSGGSGGSGGGGGTATVPKVSHQRLSPTRTTARRGTTLHLTLSEAASVSIHEIQLVAGHRSGSRCSTQAKRGKRCTAHVQRRHHSQRLKTGTHTIKLNLRGLGRGSYLVTVRASVARRSSSTLSLRLRIV